MAIESVEDMSEVCRSFTNYYLFLWDKDWHMHVNELVYKV